LKTRKNKKYCRRRFGHKSIFDVESGEQFETTAKPIGAKVFSSLRHD
jgi:hypothetical protein